MRACCEKICNLYFMNNFRKNKIFSGGQILLIKQAYFYYIQKNGFAEALNEKISKNGINKF